MVNKKATQSEKQIEFELTLGERLRKAREDEHLSISDIADQLRLSSSVIESLEKDVYSSSDMTIFVRGYIRNYARLLKIPASEIDRAFIHLGFDIGAKRSVALSFNTHQPSTKDRPMRVITYGIIAILISMVLMWRHLHQGVNTAVQTAVAHVQATQPVQPPQQVATVSTSTTKL